MLTIDPGKFPLSAFFLAGYLSRTDDPTNFPPNEVSGLLQRYEDIFKSGLSNLGLEKESLKRRSEFNFDSGNAANLESGIAILRVTEALRLAMFSNIALVTPEKGNQGADIVCEKRGVRVCVEVKTITKQSSAREGFFLEEQLYEKAREFATKAAAQLRISAKTLNCEITVLAYVVNWFEHTIYLTQAEYQQVVDKLELNGEEQSIKGIDGIWFIMKFGNDYLFWNQNGKRIDH
jgi:Holliday junction resolvase